MLVNGGRVEYVTEEDKRALYWNIPIANTTTILLGTGTSITQGAMRELSKAGVLVGFCGGSGTPLYSATEIPVDVAWLSPQSEYRPTEYLQHWVQFWFDESKRLAAAKALQLARLKLITKLWITHNVFGQAGFYLDAARLEMALENMQESIAAATDNVHLLTLEGRFAKQLYQHAARAVKYGDFTRGKQGEAADPANRFLDHGNYLAYGLGATGTWVLGLPHGLAVLHGKTRRGGLVFDAADLIKDALVLPQAFISAVAGEDDQEFRQACIQNFIKYEALDFIIDTLKDIASNTGTTA